MKVEVIIQKFADSIDGLGDSVTSTAIKNQIEKSLIPVINSELEKQKEEQLETFNKVFQTAWELIQDEDDYTYCGGK